MAKNNMLTCIKNNKIKRTYNKKTLQEENSEVLLPSTNYFTREKSIFVGF
jgi:hypothetical protein